MASVEVSYGIEEICNEMLVRSIGQSGADYSDLYNLRVCNQALNNDRSNRRFDTCDTGCTRYE